MQYQEIIRQLKSFSNPEAVTGMQRYGIQSKNMLGVSIPHLRKIAKQAGTDHRLAQRLWSSKIHDAQILASMVDDSDQVTQRQAEKWVKGFDSWGICDQCCNNLFYRTRWAHQKAVQWSRRKEAFVKRAGFVMMAVLAVHDKKTSDSGFVKYLHMIKREARDERNFVRKAVNWALRQIGKRNLRLNGLAIQTANEILAIDSRSARWIASDAMRELKSQAVQKRLHFKRS